MKREALTKTLTSWFEPGNFKDAAYNGLQVEGCGEVEKIICGVSANKMLIEAAIAEKADAIFVHHGLFWKPGCMQLSGWLKNRIALLLKENINLYAYHLPLDAHAELGNNANLAKVLSLGNIVQFANYGGRFIGFGGELKNQVSYEKAIDLIQKKIGPVNFSFKSRSENVKRVAICSGGAQSCFQEAIDSDYDLFITGEASEWVKGMAEESGTAFVAAGHHATERFGPKAVAKALSDELGLAAEFVDVPNPV